MPNLVRVQDFFLYNIKAKVHRNLVIVFYSRSRFLLVRLPQPLQFDQLGISFLERHKFLMRSGLHDLALVEDVDDIGVLDGTESMGDANGGSSRAGVVESGLDDLFGLTVECGGSFVEETIKMLGFPFTQFIKVMGEKGDGTYRILGFRIKALAIAILCFWPPDNRTPLDPQTVWNPSGNDIMKS